MENGNGKKKRELRSHPGEQWLECEFCGDFFHHNGLGMHRFHCSNRSVDERNAYQRKKHTLRLPRKHNTITRTIPVTVRFLTDRDRERLHVSFSVADSTLVEMGREAHDLGHIVLSEDE